MVLRVADWNGPGFVLEGPSEVSLQIRPGTVFAGNGCISQRTLYVIKASTPSVWVCLARRNIRLVDHAIVAGKFARLSAGCRHCGRYSVIPPQTRIPVWRILASMHIGDARWFLGRSHSDAREHDLFRKQLTCNDPADVARSQLARPGSLIITRRIMAVCVPRRSL